MKKKYIDQQGYIVIYDPGNPNATTNGWVREHRAIISKLLNRKLKRNETIHHRDGNKTNNRPDNLELVSVSQHTRLHFGNPINRRENEQNSLIQCTCGCRKTLFKYDDRGRLRRFIHRHNRRRD